MLNRGAVGSFSAIRVANTATTTSKLLQVKIASGLTIGPSLTIIYKYLSVGGTSISITSANYVDDTASVTTTLAEPLLTGTYATIANDNNFSVAQRCQATAAQVVALGAKGMLNKETGDSLYGNICKAVTVSTTGTIATNTGLEELTGTGDITRTLPAANARGAGNCFELTIKNLKTSGTATLQKTAGDILLAFGGVSDSVSVGVSIGQSIMLESNGVNKWFIVG
jgi:hypothetical protein